MQANRANMFFSGAAKKPSIYRPCACGETAHDYGATELLREKETWVMGWFCRNCRRGRKFDYIITVTLTDADADVGVG